MCDRWHHCSTGQRRRDYTKGLGPLGRFGRKPSVLKGVPQGCRNGPFGTGRRTARPVRTGRFLAMTVMLVRRCRRSECVPDVAELLADLAAKKDQGDDGDDGDESKNECVFGQPLAVV